MWVPLSEGARAALDRLLELRPAVGDAWLFPAPRAKGKCWNRWHARALLERAEAKAELPKIVGGDFHPYRRKWATERKHLAVRDVAEAGGWKSSRTLELCYYQPDPVTLLAVVTEPRKLREAKAQ
jgi:integrase